ncbi:zinc-binding dehydrogenase [Paenibacillus eucommiae]|uniref:2-desacetyl-2-hydroxyethyl bacteriochlorophyllide A dehydrogenase n=1 Tax=Paenibacillus eucommiae TaxID=1355755 RepID=A0ABS4J3W4_9BACL|nr:zinc-binding dehydrogenase [Paenibacillus eucommiae]MBP1994536.1 2-desacetyl-2-hydroxyethyl bacteriochlorophyllide A dehydrogenase [Paenibacillus eucommiae]
MEAKAVVFTDKMKVAFQAVEIPEPARDQVLIDVEYSWISIGTESSFLRQERISGEMAYKEGDPSPFPHVPGYQKVGVIRAIGPDVEGLAVGDYVFATMGEVNGMFFPSGGHISPSLTDASQVWKLPQGANPIAYSGLVLTQVGYNCGMRPPVQSGDVAVVIGDGLVGQWAAQTLLHRGAEVIVLGRHEERLRLLPESIRGINVKEVQVTEAVQAYKGINIVVDSVGAMDTFYELQPLMKQNSHFVSAGFLGTTGTIDIQTLRAQEITLYCPSGGDKVRLDATLQGIDEGWLLTEELITHQFSVEQAAEAWELILDKRQFCLGVVLKWK